ncbi:hypothetical protein C922_05529, partial [Plasmodium inui San Antonio 1]
MHPISTPPTLKEKTEAGPSKKIKDEIRPNKSETRADKHTKEEQSQEENKENQKWRAKYAPRTDRKNYSDHDRIKGQGIFAGNVRIMEGREQAQDERIPPKR